jgi:hypothetical protein
VSRGYDGDDCDYEPDYDNAWALYQQAIDRAIEGKRGQKMLRDLAEALDAMPVKRLIAGRFACREGEVCTLGALGRVRGLDMTRLDHLAKEVEEDSYMVETLRAEAAKAFGVAKSLAGCIMDRNDDSPSYWNTNRTTPETPEERWVRMRTWVASKLEVKP